MQCEVESREGKPGCVLKTQSLLLADFKSAHRPLQREGLGVGWRSVKHCAFFIIGFRLIKISLHSNMHTFSSYYSEAISHKMARICSTFKLTAIYLGERRKLLSLKGSEGKGVEERCSCYLKKPILPHLSFGELKQKYCQLGCLSGMGPLGSRCGGEGDSTVAHLHWRTKQMLLGPSGKCVLGQIKD